VRGVRRGVFPRTRPPSGTDGRSASTDGVGRRVRPGPVRRAVALEGGHNRECG